MQQRRSLDQAYTNRKLLNGQLDTPKWWAPTVIVLGILVLIGIGVISVMINKGLGVTGLSRPVFWGLFITTFVFWVGISHAGIMISAILRLTQAEWRRPVTRAAELLTVFSLLTALVFPLIHAGRPWRIAYWITPYDFGRGIYPNIRSPLIMDPVAIGTYLTGSTLFLYVALLPDLANLRDRTMGWRNSLYTVLALGWRGNPRQWKMQTVGGILLSALMLPIFVSVHSIVSWDFAVVPAVEGWHSTIFAPYFVIGAVHSGVSAVVTMMALMAPADPDGCDHRGDKIREAEGTCCSGGPVIVYACSIYGECAPTGGPGGERACVRCHRHTQKERRLMVCDRCVDRQQ